MTETTNQPAESFYHCLETGDNSGCTCPIHRDRDREPFTAPLGLSFADQVSVEPITRQQAATIYDAYHAYMDSLPSVNLAHHGLYYRGELMGAITYRYQGCHTTTHTLCPPVLSIAQCKGTSYRYSVHDEPRIRNE